MIATPQEIIAAGLQCSEEERFVIASRLLESLPNDIDGLDDDAFHQELERRANDLEGAVPWDVVKAQFKTEA